jgi:hypothetical protein
MAKARAALNHGSVHARDPQRAAEHLATIVGGLARPFHPCDGAWVCFLSGEDEDWNGPLIEFYPRDIVLARDGNALVFRTIARPAPTRSGTHFNITVPKSRAAIEAACGKLGVACSWRAWQELVEVWLEDDLLVECVPA